MVMSAPPRLQLVDTATGHLVTLRRQRAASYGRRFTVLFDHSLSELAGSLRPNSTKVFFALPARLCFRSWRRLRQVELAEAVGLSQPAISAALRDLKQHHIIESKGSGTGIEWRLCRRVGYRGSAHQYHADERAERASRPPAEPDQPGLRLGPLRVVRSRRNQAAENHLPA